jgi:alpha-ketoglutaric semialdehyde dehydrogenase
LRLSGTSIIGFHRGAQNGDEFYAFNPATSTPLRPAYHPATTMEVDLAIRLASKAFEHYRRTPAHVRASLLRAIADNVDSLGETLVRRATDETGLTAERIHGEIKRTCYQLRHFADLIVEGSWVDARIDRADPLRQPLRKPDIRSMLLPLGPVVVFCASNFPLAFSVAGGDTASALAAGCPVIVKAHHAHPGTAEAIGLAIHEAVRSFDIPEGVFALLYGPGERVGMQLVRHPLIKAGAFTGSRAGGCALMKAAAERSEPIPFYAEMSSINPVFIFPEAIKQRRDEIANGLHASVTLGAGQFCTNPGLVFIPRGRISEQFIEELQQKMRLTSTFMMLTPAISSAYHRGVNALSKHVRVETVVNGNDERINECEATTALYKVEAETFLANPDLSAEVFGPSTLLVTYSGPAQLMELARSLEGQLTATIHAAPNDQTCELLHVLEQKVGRIVFNGFPTGVEVCSSTVHGGPYPATSDGRSTSVGARAIFRFVRPLCYQDAPQSALPDELKDENPLQIWRLLDGELSKELAK